MQHPTTAAGDRRSVAWPRKGFFGAHPRNLFWPIMAEVCGVQPAWPYAARIAQLQATGIALWDVLKHCERQGSLDQHIKREEPNDFGQFLEAYPSLQAVGFNGRKAEQAFHKHVLPHLPGPVVDKPVLIPLPSTTPAHAAMTKEDKTGRPSAVAGS